MVKFKILEIDPVNRVISVAYALKDGEPRVNNIQLVGPVAGLIDLDDHESLVAYLQEFGVTHYGQTPSEPHSLVGQEF